MTLYNIHRPRRFADVKQAHVTRVLTAQIAQEKSVSTYLFSGPPGTGKTTLARIMAMALLCERRRAERTEAKKSSETDEPPARINPEPCGLCDTCVAIRDDHHRDVMEVNCATHGGVDDARDMIAEKMRVQPLKGGLRIFILDEAHMLSSQAQNALLKIMEEPPAYVRFFLCTTDAQKVVPAIQTRCQHHGLTRVSDADMLAILEDVACKERFAYEVGALELMVEAAAGSVRSALALLEQVSVVGIDQNNTRAILRRGSRAFAIAVWQAIAEVNHASAFQLIESALLEGRDLTALVEEVARVGMTMVRYMLLAPAEQDVRLHNLALNFRGSQITEVVSCLLEILKQQRQNVPADLSLQVGIIKSLDRFALLKAKAGN